MNYDSERLRKGTRVGNLTRDRERREGLKDCWVNGNFVEEGYCC